MKRIFLVSAVAILFLCSATLVTSKTKEKDIIGKWKLHLDISKAVDKETEDEDDIGTAFARGIVNMVDDLVEEIDITFDFQKNNVLVVTHDSNFHHQEESTERYRWKINKDGHIVTSSIKSKHFSMDDDDDGWILKKGKLTPIDQDDDSKGIVWLEKIK